MAKSIAHKDAAATLRYVLARLDSLTISDAQTIQRVVCNAYLEATAKQGKIDNPNVERRGRKAQEDKALADIVTDTAPVFLPELVKAWSKQQANEGDGFGAGMQMAGLAAALVKKGFLSSVNNGVVNKKAVYFALIGEIPEEIRGKFGKYQTFAKSYREITEANIYPKTVANHAGMIDFYERMLSSESAKQAMQFLSYEVL